MQSDQYREDISQHFLNHPCIDVHQFLERCNR
jgi:hypothetical protein